MLEFDLLSVGIHHKDYWTIWVGRVSTDDYSDASLLKIGTRGRTTCYDLGRWRSILGVRVEADILWLTFFVDRVGRWLYYRRRNAQLAKAVRVEANCVCGHDIQAHSEDGAYFMVPCGMCQCVEYVPAEYPYCVCGHSGDEHVKLGPNLFLGCLDEECGCDIYTPESVMGGIARLCQELMEENAE